MAFFQETLGPNGVITDEATLTQYNEDWLQQFKGRSSVCLRPTNAEEVSAIMKHCNQRRLAVVPQGGNTGLVGGSVPLHDEVVLSTQRMNNILDFDETSGIVTVQAGVILEQLETYLHERDHTVPLDLGAKGSCHIGGNISTNAGGLRLLRFGSLKGSVLGLEGVLADGTIVDNCTGLRKDNTGYDFKQLFIGAEGTLGVITKASILVPPKSPAVHVAFLAVPDFIAARRLLHKAKRECGEILSAFEFMDRKSLDVVLEQQEGCRDPFSERHPIYVLIETMGSNEEHDAEKLNSFLERAMVDGFVLDGTIAQDGNQVAGLWNLRERISESLTKYGALYKYDISIPGDKMYDIVNELQEHIGDQGNCVGFGHMGDGNLHLNITTPDFSDDMLHKIEDFIYPWTANAQGSVSAEHGIGFQKKGKLHYSKDHDSIALMARLKKLFDPQGILNPYKVIPDEYVLK
eukprot:TRINITY_DN2071_c0_g1_i2.p1 TRINITY_DN2071_c0_g1~~TRINITY_DN2071_c0_g1_i2.p1  ORF type:complete len:461 (+),score=117.92 TRINITY_DN2071_c0_g1_i2:356-1738(+)